jgi:serine/threonine protein kinase
VVPPRTPADLGLPLAAGFLVLVGGALLFSRSTPLARTAAVPGSTSLESTLKFGSTRQQNVAPDIMGPIAGRSPVGVGQARAGAVSMAPVPAPHAVPSTPAPVGPPRHATVPGGVPVSEDGTPGQKFGRYSLLDRLGQGGMADVFTAVAHGVEGFSRVFVLKRLRPELAQDKDAVAQFIDEARMQSNLVHSNIVPVFDFGRVAHEYFMTQEYIVGRDLIRLMARYYEDCRQTLTPRLAYYIAHETLQALQYAHTKLDREGQHLGIVHRDVSAGNIIMSAQGEVKLADFGIVKSNRSVSKTQMGTVKGNANFMSPEQARGQSVDARSDLFSVALVLYYCLTNRLLYDGTNDLEVLFKAASGATMEDYESIRRLASPAGDVLGRALAPDPADRFQSAAEFADVLAPHIGGAKAEAVAVMQRLFGDELRREAA